MIDLKGQVAIVTGGSRGIGRAICLKLAEAGANVVVGYHRSTTSAQEVVSAVKNLGREAVAIGCDLANATNGETLFAVASSNFKRANIVVANAGIWERAPIDEMSYNQWRHTMSVNLDSVYNTCCQAAKHMKACGGGKLILIGSTAGQRGEANYSHYAASKGAIIALTRSLAAELGPYRIHVNCVAPGWVETDMTASVFSDKANRQKIEASIPLRKIASPDDVAGPVLFLASDLSNHVQGQVIGVNGGSVLQ